MKRAIVGGFVCVLAGGLLYVTPALKSKSASEKNYRDVSISVHLVDLTAFSDSAPLNQILNQLKSIPIAAVSSDLSLSATNEAMIRRYGFNLRWLVWQKHEAEQLVSRFQENDAVSLQGESLIDAPFALNACLKQVEKKNGFILHNEFLSIPLLKARIKSYLPLVLKEHELSSREAVYPKTDLWANRLVRAVRERSVRALSIRMSPGLSLEANLSFVSEVTARLSGHGYKVGSMKRFPLWPFRRPGGLMSAGLFLAVLAPIVVLVAATGFKTTPPLLLIVFLSGISILTGVLLHGIGARPDMVLGLSQFRGIKLQLLLPLLLGLVILISPQEWAEILETPLKGKHLAIGGMIAALVGGLYLMRSGNFPILSVSDGERHFRDMLEQWLGARPRTKEVLFGHPLFLWGLYQWQKRGPGNFITDGRFCLWFGLIGQISIVNTFLHFHTPLSFGLLRSAHGLWMGSFLGWVAWKATEAKS